MALLFFDGFEGVNNTTAPLRYSFFNNGNGGISNTIITNPPVRNGNALFLNNGTVRQNFISSQTIIAGVRHIPIQMGGIFNDGYIIKFADSTDADQLTIRYNQIGQVSIRRGSDGGTILWQSDVGIVFAGVWDYWEVKATVHPTQGSVELRKNGISLVQLTNINTLATSTQNYQRVIFRNPGNFQGHYVGFDDFYICDTTGTAPYNNFLGPIRVLSINPNAQGTTNQWSASGGAGTNWDMVNDINHDADSTYVESGTAGAIDLYNCTSPNTTSNVIGAIKINAFARGTDGAPRNLQLAVKPPGTSTVYAENVGLLQEGYYEFSRTIINNPSTNFAWTKAELDDIQIGVKVPD